jgi:hypothetical protein
MSRLIVIAAAVISFFPAAAIAQAPATRPPANQIQGKKSPLVPYAGNWVGIFEGKPWMILNLSVVGEQFSGALQRTSAVDLNDNGELKKVSEEFVTEPLVEGRLNPDGLLLTVKNEAQAERYLMKLTSESTAEIKMLAMTMPPGMPKPKPWKLTKAGVAPAKQP